VRSLELLAAAWAAPQPVGGVSAASGPG